MKNFTEFRAYVFGQMTRIIDDRNCSTYRIMGYKYLSQKLILEYHDCYEVFEWDFIPNDADLDVGGEVRFKKFFTKNFDNRTRPAARKRFTIDYDREKPEKPVKTIILDMPK